MKKFYFTLHHHHHLRHRLLPSPVCVDSSSWRVQVVHLRTVISGRSRCAFASPTLRWTRARSPLVFEPFPKEKNWIEFPHSKSHLCATALKISFRSRNFKVIPSPSADHSFNSQHRSALPSFSKTTFVQPLFSICRMPNFKFKLYTEIVTVSIMLVPFPNMETDLVSVKNVQTTPPPHPPRNWVWINIDHLKSI